MVGERFEGKRVSRQASERASELKWSRDGLWACEKNINF